MTGAELIAAERRRQIEEEGWSATHDEQHADGELAEAARCYALDPIFKKEEPPDTRIAYGTYWPWSWEWWKPKGQIRDLVRAGALIAAEIDRLQRDEPPDA